ncbi:MAG TPA: DUF4845 domain-containing protein [Spongiibacteraceae bacterium]|jgi:hypothetical protein|nr:DUF4845 domain-containing protein [Spongiibacteraceae bacterium]HUH37410.1 DUF4845 domain-containing protein [Spongiibacteraceae bacterium]
MNSLYRQRGLGAIGWMLVLLIASFFLTCSLTLLPVYFDAYEIRSILTDLTKDPEARRADTHKLRSILQRRFDTNRVEAIKGRDVKIAQKKGQMIIDATYEVRKPLIMNIDVVVKFDDLVFEVPAES